MEGKNGKGLGMRLAEERTCSEMQGVVTYMSYVEAFVICDQIKSSNQDRC